MFVLNDNPAGNQVVAYDADATGALHQAGVYSTGGLGGILTGSVVDHTASQGALTYDPSTTSCSRQCREQDDLGVPRFGDTCRGQLIGSGGTFPVSVTARRGDLRLERSDGGSVQGLRAAATFCPLPLASRAWTGDAAATPFTRTPGEVAVSPDGSKLLVTTKGSGNPSRSSR